MEPIPEQHKKTRRRRIRHRAHEQFDEMWRSGYVSRTEAYRWLSKKMEVRFEDCHFREFTEYQCLEAIRHCRGWWARFRQG